MLFRCLKVRALARIFFVILYADKNVNRPTLGCYIPKTDPMLNLYTCISHSNEISLLWYALIGKQIPLILDHFPDITVDDIGEEHFRVLANGDGEIYVTIRDYEIRLRVPQDQWCWN